MGSETDRVELSGHTGASVRSAIQRLADAGFLTIGPRRGAQGCLVAHTEQFRALAGGFREVARSRDQTVMTKLPSACFTPLLLASDNRFATRSLRSVKGLSRRFWVLSEAHYSDVERVAS